jgi:hypothetical protein
MGNHWSDQSGLPARGRRGSGDEVARAVFVSELSLRMATVRSKSNFAGIYSQGLWDEAACVLRQAFDSYQLHNGVNRVYSDKAGDCLDGLYSSLEVRFAWTI